MRVLDVDGIYMIVENGIPVTEQVFGSYADALCYQRQIQRSLVQVPDFDYDFYDEALA